MLETWPLVDPFPWRPQLWRKNARRNAMIQSSQIREHMEVVGSDGEHVGRVDHVQGEEIELAKLDLGSGLKHHMIPMSWVDDIDDDKLVLNRTKDAAKAAWREKH
jgi:hypothetical protein